MLRSVDMTGIFEFVVVFMASPAYVRSPHLRGKLAELLYHAFLPASAREDEDGGGGGGATSPPCVELLRCHPLGLVHLTPSLLELFGDVEKTGEYDR